MDSRDIKEIPPLIPGNKYLEEIFKLQKGLLENYIGIEGLPQYPLNVNTRNAQSLLKDFTSRVIEELAEGYESLELLSSLAVDNQLFISAGYDPKITKSFIMALNHLQNASEEMADALHFFTELLIYANIQPDDIKSWMIKCMKDAQIESPDLFETIERDTLMGAMRVGTLLQSRSNRFFIESDIRPSSKINLLDIYSRSQSEGAEPLDPDYIPEYDTHLLNIGSIYNEELYYHYKALLWTVTYSLNLARNFLRNKPWKQSQVLTNEVAYQSKLVESFVLMMGAFYFMGVHYSYDLFYIYFKKNKVNQFRQKSKY